MPQEKPLKYFAYGSNLHPELMVERVPSARFLTVARLPGHQLRFHKRGGDGTGKCNAFATGNPLDELLGVLWEMASQDLPLLDEVESYGYERREVQIVSSRGLVEAFSYFGLADFLDDSLRPNARYKDSVVLGARHWGLPKKHLSWLEALAIQK